ncbi:MAG: decarboxylating 6-phosphogluconate dehydrogenase [Geobacteraceae bacterium]|nr:decarboxylating 6-phosphogluconate dehydrogenase [Geobacteraceae bacterium]
MQVAIAGLGRMGINMARRLLRGGHEVVAWNRSPGKVEEIAAEGARPAFTLEEMVEMLTPPRAVWLMLPAGEVVDETIEQLVTLFSPGDCLLDGGNSFYRDDVRRKNRLEPLGIHYLDVGVSGGIWGLKEGYCLMVGGDHDDYSRLEPLFRTLAPEEGYLYCGETGAGHFVKMVHNGIEYGMMAAYGEGFSILKASPYGQAVDPAAVAHLWNRGSVVRSWLLELAEEAFRKDPNLKSIQGYVEDSGEGRWTVQQAIDTGVPVPVIAASLFQRFRSRLGDSFGDKVLAALRNEFGGHAVLKAGGEKQVDTAGAGDVRPATPQKNSEIP